MQGVVLEPSPSEFARPHGHATVVPVSCELLADLDTPISAYMKLRDLPSSFLLESVEGGAPVARFSVLGGDPRLVLESDGRDVRVTTAAGTTVAIWPVTEQSPGRTSPPSSAASSATSATTPSASGSGCPTDRPMTSACRCSGWGSWTPWSSSTTCATPSG